jgi:hypothetical protein
MSKEMVYKLLASLIDARLNCIKSKNTEWIDNHEDSIEMIMKEHAPSGSGFDNGTSFDYEKSTGERLVFNTSFHHMNENGYYNGWTGHAIVCTPSLAFDFLIRVTGKDRNDIKNYIGEMFEIFLHTEIERK